LETVTNNGKQTRVATIPQYAAIKGVSVRNVENWVKQNCITTLRQNGRTVIDVDASEKTHEATARKNLIPPPEVLLQRLLAGAEAAAQKSNISLRRWQLFSFVLLIFLVGALVVGVLLYMDVNVLTADQGRLRMDKYNVTEQLNLAGVKLSQFERQIETLKNQNDQLAVENAGLETKSGLLSARSASVEQTPAAAESKPVEDEMAEARIEPEPPSPLPQDQLRLTDISKGIYPHDMTRAELIAALGEPDRIYKDTEYEQLVYFDRSPGRFWFKNGPFAGSAE
jgi:regulator of replication initiation timing